jgi:hypothetical protein
MKTRPRSKSSIAQPPAKPLRGRKTWREKLHDDKDLPKTIPNPYKTEDARATGTMLIPVPREVDAQMRRVPRGKLTTIDELRKKLASKHKATVTCPITTGSFAGIAAHAAPEDSSAGEAEVTPYWRTLKAQGEIGHGEDRRRRRWRDKDGASPVDATGTLKDGTKIGDTFMTCALGRKFEWHDEPALGRRVGHFCVPV